MKPLGFISSASLASLMPAAMLLITIEIVIASYKAFSSEWTKTLAIGNFIINLLWICLISIFVINPAIIQHAVASFFASIFQKAPEDIYGQVRWIIIGIGLATIVTTAIDAFAGFRKQEKSDPSI